MRLLPVDRGCSIVRFLYARKAAEPQRKCGESDLPDEWHVELSLSLSAAT